MKIFSKIIVMIDFSPPREHIKDTTKIATFTNTLISK